MTPIIFIYKLFNKISFIISHIFPYLLQNRFLNLFFYYNQMFLKKLFGKSPKSDLETTQQSQTAPLKMPMGHPGGITDQDKQKCPFFNKSKQNIKQNSHKKQKKMQEEEPRGGCPFMNSSEDQKNPGLQLYHQAYDEDYVSKFRYYLSKAKIDLDYFQNKGKRRNRERIIFDSYPIYIQHTLFYNSQDLVKIRTFECCSRFMAYEELREKGNKEFNKGNYGRALDYYERAMSLYKWLQYSEDLKEENTEMMSQMNLKSESSIGQSEIPRSKIQFNLQEQGSKNGNKQKNKKQKDELRTKYKEFFVFYCDQNTKLFDGQQMVETPDIDMRKSLLVQIYLNMAACYIKLNHYSVALQCCNDAQSLTDKVSQILLRKAQALSLNKSATLNQLTQAKQIIQKAIKNKPNEKIYSSTNQNILKMLNLHDADQAYGGCLKLIQEQIVIKTKFVEQKRNAVIQRAKQIHQIQQDIISKGRQPIQRILEKKASQSSENRIILRMRDKYLRIIDFYTQTDKLQQVQVAKDQLQEVLRVIYEMNTINNVCILDIPQNVQIGQRTSQKIIRRIQKIKTQQSEAIYNQGKYNFQVLQWAIKEIVDEQFKQRQLIKKKKQEQDLKYKQQMGIVQQKGNPFGKYIWLLLLLPIIAILLSRFVI